MSTRTKLILASVFGLFFGIASALVASIAQGAEIVKKDDMPALRGGKQKATANPIPTCFGGSRAKLESTEDVVKEWAAGHEKHECATASTVYVCRAGKNLSVRCE